MIGSRPRVVLIATLLISGFLWCQMIGYEIGHLLRMKPLFNLFDMCVFMFRILHVPAPVAWNLVHSLVLYTFAAMLWMAVRHVRASLRSSRELLMRLDPAITDQVGKQFELDSSKLLVIEHAVPVALTMGLWKPRIILSTGLLDMLTAGELQAVIEHEKYHLRHRDPLAISALTMCSVAMWYIPIFRWVADKYKIMIELRADKYAISKMERAVDLGSALLKLLKQGQMPHVSLSHASFAETSMNLRIMHILDPQFQVSFKLPMFRLLVSVVAVIVLMGLI